MIHAATLTPVPATPVSQPIPGKSTLPLAEILQKADAALLGATTTFIRLPQKPDGVFLISKKLQTLATACTSLPKYCLYTDAIIGRPHFSGLHCTRHS